MVKPYDMSHLFKETVSVQRMSGVPDGELGETKTYSTVFTGVKCWIADHQGIDTLEEFGHSGNYSHEMTTQQAGIIENDVVIFGTRRFTVKRPTDANTPTVTNHYVLLLEELK